MKLGIKVAPGNAYKADIEAATPSMVEVWYNASRPDDYNELFAYLATQHLDVGLHFWGAIHGYLANTSYPDYDISLPSMALMYKTIDVAAKHHCVYVNVHPDLYSLLKVNFATMDIRVASQTADRAAQRTLFLNNMVSLNDYAASRNVVLTVETVPMRDTSSWNPYRSRAHPIDIHQMNLDVHTDLAARGIAIANDFCHTACNIISADRARVWRFLKTFTRSLAPATKLIHLGYVIPPYNGVDFHDSLDNSILETNDAVPNNKEIVELLKLFRNRDDVYMLVEPKEDHIKNYILAKKFVAKSEAL